MLSIFLIIERREREIGNEMEEELNGLVPCSSVAVDSIIRVGTAGAIWGLCRGPYDARKRGLTGTAQASFVTKSIGKFSFQCGLFAGVITLTRCGIQKYRGKSDWVNASIAGAVAGASIAAATRNWTEVVKMAALVSAFSTAADYSRVF